MLEQLGFYSKFNAGFVFKIYFQIDTIDLSNTQFIEFPKSYLQAFCNELKTILKEKPSNKKKNYLDILKNTSN